jgi:hypothetical protein
MPRVFYEIPEMSTHILEAISEQNIHNSLYQLGMTNKIKDRIYIDYGYSSIKSRTVRSLDANLRNNKVHCQVDVNLLPQGAKIDNYTFIHAPSYGVTNNSYATFKPLLYDVNSNIHIYEQTMPTTITTTYSFSLIERSLAYSLSARIKNIYGDGSQYETKDVMFSYPFPIPLLNLLFGLYKLKDGDKLPYPKYLVQYSNGHITFSTNRTIQSIEVIVQKTNVEALSNYAYDEDKPTEQKSRRVADTYELKLVHTLQLSLPNSLSMEYPIIVDNKPVPEELVVLNKSKPLRNLEQTGDILPWRRVQDNRMRYYNNPIKLPEYDSWIVPTQAKAKHFSYHEFYQAAFCLDEGENQEIDVFDKDHMSGFTFHPIVDHFLMLQGQETFNHDVLFNITVYKNNYPIGAEYCTMDNFGKVNIKTSDTTKIHRFVISEITDLRFLNEKWLIELLKWCEDPTHTCPLRAIEEYYRYINAGGNPNDFFKNAGGVSLKRIRFFFRACKEYITQPRSLMNHPASVI